MHVIYFCVLLHDDPTLFSKEALTLSRLRFEEPWLEDLQVSPVSAKEEKKSKTSAQGSRISPNEKATHVNIHKLSAQWPEY